MNTPLETDDIYKVAGLKNLCRCLKLTKRGADTYALIQLKRTTLEINAAELSPMFRLCLN